MKRQPLRTRPSTRNLSTSDLAIVVGGGVPQGDGGRTGNPQGDGGRTII